MDRKNTHSESPLGCPECREGLQDYLDGTLEKTLSLRFFLHLRDCSECQAAHDELQSLFGMLDNMPELEVPADFDQKILASVPYEAYKAMEPIRRQRVPVYLEEEFLPVAVRSPLVRASGAAVAVAGIVSGQVLGSTELVSVISLLGLVPELLVRLQGVARRATLAVRRSEG